MSRLSASRNNSKTVYQGMVLNRTHRSEYDDNQLRDQARHNTRLDHEIKNVERARTVMAKSMEADKQLFMKSGVQNNIRVTKSRQSATNPRQQTLTSQAAAAQHHRLVSDTRVKRSSLSDTDAVDTGGSTARSPKQGQAKVTSSSASTTTSDQKQQRDTNNNVNTTNKTNNINNDGNNNNNNNTSSKSKDSVPNTDSLYDSFLLDNLSDQAMSRPAHTLATPVRQLDTRSSGTNTRGDTGTGKSGSVEQTATKSSSKTPERRPPLFVDAGSSSKAKPVSHQTVGQTSRVDNSAGRPRTKWDNLATPKHSSPQLSKRAQIEQEFARSTAGNSPSSPAAHQARLLGTFTLTAGSSTPTPVTTATTTAAASTSSSATATTQRKKSAQRKQ